MLFLVSFLHHSDSRILDRSEDYPDPRADCQPNWLRSFSHWRVFFGPGSRRDAGDGGLHSTDSHKERKRRSQEISFGPKLRKRGSSVTPEGNKGKKNKEKGSRTVSHVTRIPDGRPGTSESSSARESKS